LDCWLSLRWRGSRARSCRWCHKKSGPIQLAYSLIVTAIILGTGLGLSVGVRGNFCPPPEWKSRRQATVERLNLGIEEEKPREFRLIKPGDSITAACHFFGYALCGLWILRIGDVSPRSTAHRCVNIMLGVPLLVVLVLAARQLEQSTSEVMSDGLLRLLHPSLVGVVLPGLTARLFVSWLMHQSPVMTS
jgi:hypothetical protein